MAYGPMGSMRDIFMMQQGATPPMMQSNAQGFISPVTAGMKTPQFNGMMSQMSGAVPPAGPNPFMALLQNMKGGAGGGQGMMNPLMGPIGGPGAAQANPYNQMMDDNFWTYLLQQMFPQKK